MSHILVAGGTGLIGSRLCTRLQENGHQVALLSRKPGASGKIKTYQWDPARGTIDLTAIQQADAVINLAGAGIADTLWTAARKRLIVESRAQSTALLRQAIQSTPNNVQTYLSASAIGFYGHAGEEWLEETASTGKGFLAESTKAWEDAFHEVEKLNIRAVALRIGIVLTPKGGALEKILLPFKGRVGSYFGNGRQWYSWIHIEDVCRLFLYAMENIDMRGIYNAVAPNPVTNKELVESIAKVRGGFNLIAPVPAFLLRTAMGEMADVILNSNRVSAKKTVAAGFTFQYPELSPALEALLKK
ncbi:MAG: TIGR01777 family protein [Saprospirales bacterium]|nr:TIGR01777 family protein [Saprospirales bacterium]MBK8491774.1 TIGR01777 family protein [Saprospirales bacterium]